MRVDIQHRDENIGLPFWKHIVPVIRLTIQFSPDELATIKAKGLEDFEFHTSPISSYVAPHMQGAETVKRYLDGRSHRLLYDTKAHAQADDPRLRESLKNLKELIDAHSQEPQSGAYEL